MSTRKNFTKDELKGFITILKDITGVEYNTRNLPNKEVCMSVIYKIISDHAQKRIMESNSLLIAENMFLKTQIRELKNKKWWQFWR